MLWERATKSGGKESFNTLVMAEAKAAEDCRSPKRPEAFARLLK